MSLLLLSYHTLLGELFCMPMLSVTPTLAIPSLPSRSSPWLPVASTSRPSNLSPFTYMLPSTGDYTTGTCLLALSFLMSFLFPPSMTQASSFLELVGYVNSAHANNLHQCCSTTGYVFLLDGGAIAWHTKMQSITAASSTKAEFLATVSAAKVTKYLRLVLQQIGFAQPKPTLLFEDKISAIHMINAIKPTNALVTLTSSTLPFKTGTNKAILNPDLLLASSIPLKTLPRLLAGFYTPTMPAASWDILARPSSSNFFYSPFLGSFCLSSFTFHPLIFFCSVYSITDQGRMLAPGFHFRLKVLAQQYFT